VLETYTGGNWTGSGPRLNVHTPSGFTVEMTDYVAVTGALGAEMQGGVVVPVVRGISSFKLD